MLEGKRYVIAVCTSHRPRMLSECLASLQTLLLPAGATVEILVVENDIEPKSQSVACSSAAAGPLIVNYVQEPRRGIPIARNRALDECAERGYDRIALIDDDERARPDWLAELSSALDEFSADVAHGPVQQLYERPLPRWWKPLKRPVHESGTELDEAPTNNILMNGRIIGADGLTLRFDARLTFGNEDVDFFRRARASGAKIVWAANAWVEETIPATRVTPSRLLSRARMSGAALAFNTAMRSGYVPALVKFAPKGIRRIISGLAIVVLASLIRPFDHEKSVNFFYSGLTRIYRGIGNLQGLTAIRHNYYSKIDGY
jgi:succinoglycan biosynthesis protein ExoM